MITVEELERWNAEHPDHAHSPYMGILDDEILTIEDLNKELEEDSPEEEETEVEVSESHTEVQTPVRSVPTSPKTGEIQGGIEIMVLIMFSCIVGIFFTIGFKNRTPRG